MKQALVVLCIVFLLPPGRPGTQDFTAFRDLTRPAFDRSFSKADRATSPGLWWASAQGSLSQVRESTEVLALKLFADPDERSSLLAQLDQWTEAELERRFAQWLTNYFMADPLASAHDQILAGISSANRQYLYHTDEAGKILYDAATGDPLVIRPDEGGLETAEEDSREWKTQVQRTAKEALGELRSRYMAHLPELLPYLREDRREAFESLWRETAESRSDSQEKELTALVDREAKLFMDRRTADLWSQRRKSESGTAERTVAELIEEISAPCEKAIESLQTRIEQAQGGTGDLAVQGKEWLEEYQTQFQRGLAAWENAEQRFLAQRIEWERDAGQAYLTGESAWNDAFGTLEKERQAWETRLQTLFDQGERTYQRASETLDRAILQAKTEFQRDAELRAQGGADRAQAWISMYQICGTVLRGARENASYWGARLAPPQSSFPPIDDPNLDSWIEGRLKELWSAAKKAYEALNRGPTELWMALDSASRQPPDEGLTAELSAQLRSAGVESFDSEGLVAGMELRRWSSLYKEYSARALEARNVLTADFGLAVGSGLLADVLDPSVSKEYLFLDEYQIELIRSQAVASYWDHRYRIALAVDSYAQDRSALRITDGESLDRWQRAKEAYDRALELYQGTQQNLIAQGRTVSQTQALVQEAQEQLNQATARLEDLNQEYALLMSSYALQRDDLIKNEIAASSYTLSQIQGRIDSVDDPPYIRYLERARALSLAQEVEKAGEALRTLILGAEGEASLAELALAAQDGTDESRSALEGRVLYLTQLSSDLKAPDSVPWNEEAFADPQALVQPFMTAPQGPQRALADYLSALEEENRNAPPWVSSVAEPWIEALLDYAAASYSVVAVPSESFESSESLGRQLDEKNKALADLLANADGFPLPEGSGDSLTDDPLAVRTLEREIQNLGYRLSFADKLEAERARNTPSAEQALLRFERQNRIWRSALTLWREGEEGTERNVLRDAIQGYIDDPTLGWDDRWALPLDQGLVDAYRREAENFQGLLEEERTEQRKIERLEEALALVSNNTALSGALERLGASIAEQRTAYQQALALYATQADQYGYQGGRYDELYGIMKQRYAQMEEARFLYEKEDAIRTWASSAYLKAQGEDNSDRLSYRDPVADVVYTRDRKDRAEVALRALGDLYAPDTAERPYEDPEYRTLYQNYQESYRDIILTAKARNTLAGELEREYEKNQKLAQTYTAALSVFKGNVTEASTPWSPYLTLHNGALTLSYDSNYVLTPGSPLDSVAVEQSLSQWGVRMAAYRFDAERYKRWGLARDFLLLQLRDRNPSLTMIRNEYHLADNIYNDMGNMEVHYRSLRSRMDDFRNPGESFFFFGIFWTPPGLSTAQRSAWESLSPQERSDLETYVALTLSGQGGNSSDLYMFSHVSAYLETQNVDSVVTSWKNWEDGRRSNWFYGWWADIEYHKLEGVQNAYRPLWEELQRSLASGAAHLKSQTEALASSFKSYQESNERIAAMEGRSAPGQGFQWQDLERALSAAGTLSTGEIGELKNLWTAFSSPDAGSGASVVSVLEKLFQGAKNRTASLFRALEGTAQAKGVDQSEAQGAYRSIFDDFVEGRATLQTLNTAGQRAFGETAASERVYLEDLERALSPALLQIALGSSSSDQEALGLAQNYGDLIKRVYQSRFQAELAARQAEWDLKKRDLEDQRQRWMEASQIMASRGREDWARSLDTLRERYGFWKKQYQRTYAETADSWDRSYLQGLRDKESWVARATEAADTAMGEALLSAVGVDGQTLSRSFDTLQPLGSLDPSIVSIRQTLSELLDSHMGLDSALAVLSRDEASILPSSAVLASGLDGLGLWQSAQAQASVALLLHQSNQELAVSQTRLLASRARDMADAAIQTLNRNLAQANEDVRVNMDRTFILQGRWRRDGPTYVKDVVDHSTVFNPIITTRASVPGYIAYVMNPWKLNTDLSDSRLANLNAQGISALIAQAQGEVEKQGQAVFGTSGQGLFGKHVGSEPTLKGKPNVDDGMENIWTDRGTGELGRLLRGYIYWSLREQKGMAEIAKPLWDKSLWDDRDSWFKSPSIRGVADMGVSLVATAAAIATAPLSGGASFAGAIALNTALNMSDDAVFTFLDVSGGYKTWDQGGVDLGKRFLSSAATSALGGAISGTGGLTDLALRSTSGMGSVVTKTALTGLQGLGSTTLSSAINAVQWNASGFSWSQSDFNRSFKGGLIGTVGAMAGTGISGGLGLINLEDGNSIGLSNRVFRTDDIRNLNTLTGNLSDQALQYALGGTFTVNVANLNSLALRIPGASGTLNSGLLELQVSSQGTRMALGTGGADLQLSNLPASLGALGDTWRISSAKISSLFGQYEQVSTLNAVNMLGYTPSGLNIDVARGIWNGNLTVQYGSPVTGTGTGAYGLYNSSDPSRIELSRDLLGPGKEVSAQLAAVLAHEGTHAAGNRYEALAHQQALATYGSLLRSFDLKGNGEFTRQMISGLTDPRSYQANGGPQDFWKMTNDGRLVYDGKASLVDENGRTLLGYKQMGLAKDSQVEGGLLAIFGIGENETQRINQARQIMANALKHSSGTPDQWFWVGTQNVAVGSRGSFPITEKMNLSDLNRNRELDMEQILLQFGNTLLGQVFASYYNSTVDSQLAAQNGKNLGTEAQSRVVYSEIQERYGNLLRSKQDFYSSMRSFVDLSKDYYISYGFGEKDDSHYLLYNKTHYGFDLSRSGGPLGDPLVAGLSGVVDSVNWNPGSIDKPANGNSVRIEYGFPFEQNFIGTGIYGEYLHLKDKPELTPGSAVSPSQQIGSIGGSFGYDPHLHFDFLTRENAFQHSTLAYMLGADFGDFTVSSKMPIKWQNIYVINHTYDPEMFYKNRFNYTFKRK